MTAQHVETSAKPAPPERTLDAVTHAIEGCGEAEVVEDFEHALGTAWSQARANDTLTPLLELVDKWWPEATLWTVNPDEARRVYADMRRTAREGLTDYQRAQLITKRAARSAG